jgi:hypothetical protein
MTITLPNFGKDFERSLDLGYVPSDLFSSFAKTGGLPKFLSGFLSAVFEPTSGVLLDDPSIEAIRSVRQLTLFFGKIKLPCSEERVAKAFDDFIKCESEVRESDKSFWEIQDGSRRLVSNRRRQFERVGSLLFRDLFQKADCDIAFGNIVPKHGPGATAEKLTSNGKYLQREWTARLEKIFPVRDFLIPNERFFESLDLVHFREPGDERPVRVIHVPKTLKTPRIIAIEPACMQYVQQGIMESLREEIESSWLNHFIGFKFQEPNQLLAREGSREGKLATLDLSEASDRVSNQHVRALTRNFPWLARGIDACRSRKADVPGHGVIRLAKFASMGSALTFPLEAMVFLTVIFCGIERDLNTSLDRGKVMSFLGSVRVYGDDIIVPVKHVRSVMEALEAFGFKVNKNKSFWNGKFRESCGKEYYAGADVSIVRFRNLLPRNRQQVEQIVGTSKTRNLLYERGYWATSAYLDNTMERVLKGRYPRVEDTSVCIGRSSFLGYQQDREDPDLHHPLVRGWTVRNVVPPDPLDGHAALQKYFLKRGSEPFFSEDHLERAGRPLSVNIISGWFRPY